MDFRIADTFTDSLARLAGDEQKAVKTTAFDLQMNPANPGMSLHKLDRARDANFWSLRASRDLRLIVHRTEHSLLLCYVGHHDDAYRWAERRKLERHPKTGAAQLVEVRERVEEIRVPRYVESPAPTSDRRPLFTAYDRESLLGYGVPEDWVEDVQQADEDSLLVLADHLPAEAAEALLELAVGGTPRVTSLPPEDVDPFAHPDAQRRFRLVEDSEELQQALDYPWEKWSVFLHPAQRELVEQSFSGPARVAGSAGTGKTVVALHRAVHLARKNPEARILLATFSDALANMLHTKLRRLAGHQPRVLEHVEVDSLDTVGMRLYARQFGPPRIADESVVEMALAQVSGRFSEHQFPQRFLLSEWHNVIDAWQIDSWEAYRSFARRGQKTRLAESHRESIWPIFVAIRERLAKDGLTTMAQLFNALAEQISQRSSPPYEYAVIDEAQDLSVPQLSFLAALGDDRPDSLFFAGDQGQRIFQAPFSWKSLGVDIRGRSRVLRVNYRTSHQIRTQADRLLDPEVSDLDGNMEERKGTVSVFNGPPPRIEILDSPPMETQAVAAWLQEQTAAGIAPDEMAVFVRSSTELPRAIQVASEAGLKHVVLDESLKGKEGHLALSTMHLTKGLEYRAVAIMACDDEVIPSQARIEDAADTSDLEDIYNTERHLFYVACTRAREKLWISGVQPASEFLDDLA
ncbi:MAG: UvrD-helicase domain-containing protein [Xanthomonadales bacterium]|nr:UvrD-helicase domain-containing protein [Xanthomonadales bacterium]